VQRGRQAYKHLPGKIERTEGQREQQTNRQIKFGIFYKLEKELQKRKVY
jgi:hypothetical protein